MQPEVYLVIQHGVYPDDSLMLGLPSTGEGWLILWFKVNMLPAIDGEADDLPMPTGRLSVDVKISSLHTVEIA